MAFGNADQQQYCRTVHLSLETLSQTTLGDAGIINLLEKLLTLLQIQGCFPLGFSQQYEYQQDLPDKKSILSKEAGAVISSFGWRQHTGTCNTSGPAWRLEFVLRLSSALSGSNMSRSSSMPPLLKQHSGTLASTTSL